MNSIILIMIPQTIIMLQLWKALIHHQLHCKKMTITNENMDFRLLLDSGRGCTIINMSLAKEIMFNCMQAQWSEKKPLELKSFSNDIAETLGTLKSQYVVTIGNFKKQKSR